MKFLSKLGQAVLKGVQIVMGFAPLAQQVYPSASGEITTVTNDLNAIGQIISEVEVVGQALALPGAQKLTAAAPLVSQIILQSALMANHKVNDEALFTQGATKIADGMADVMNSWHADVSTQSKT